MMNEYKSQAELLDLYLEALAQNPQASVPTGLDEKMAVFARQLMAAEAVESPARATQQRVWAKMMAAARQPSAQAPTPYSPNGRTHSSIRPQDMEEMMHTSTYLHAPGLEGRSMETQTRRHVNFSLAAATIVLMFFAAILGYAMLPKDGKMSGAVGLQASSTALPQTVTSTPIPTELSPQPTGTPISETGNPSVPVFTLPAYQPALIPLNLGSSIEGALNGDEPTYYYLIQGRAGDLLTVSVNASDLVSVGYFVQYAPQIGGGDGTGGGGGGGGGGGSEGQPTSQTITIPVTEDAAIIFNVQNEAGGRPITYTIELGQVEIPLLNYNETVTDHFSYDRPGFPYIYYDFVGQRGDIVHIMVESIAMDWMLTLTQLGENRELAQDDDSGAGRNPEIEEFQLPMDGTYRLELSPLNLYAVSGDDFTLTVLKQEPVTLTPNEHTLIYLSEKQLSRVLTFEGQAGQSVELTIEYSDLASLANFLIEQSGQVLDQVVAYIPPTVFSPLPDGSVSASPSPQRLVRQITIPADGTVTIFVNTDASSADPNMMSYWQVSFLDVFDVLLTTQ
ncbi:MAG: hypothetical protein HY862_16540 [Chloroflexi bacterium]|nr:hypothetical protein [Chloroflexota bacterium]